MSKGRDPEHRRAHNAAKKLLLMVEMVARIEGIDEDDIMIALYMALCIYLGGNVKIEGMAQWMLHTIEEFIEGHLDERLPSLKTDTLKRNSMRDATVHAVVIDMYGGLKSGKYKTRSGKLLDSSNTAVQEMFAQLGLKGESGNDNKQ